MPEILEDEKARPASPAVPPAVIGTALRFLLCLGLLFGGHAVLRALLSPTANLDEAEQLMLTQEWALGYGPQPPLYTWLQACVFNVFGVSIFALAILKNALLFSTYALAYLSAKMITGRHGAGVLASLSLLFIPQIVWESQRDLTHSVLAATASMAALYCFLKSRKTGWIGWYLLFGSVLGIGALAKYNFLLWAAGLLGAAISLPAFRKAVLNWKMTIAIALATAIVAPHAAWAIRNPDRVAQTVSKLKIEQGSAPTADAKSSISPIVTKALVARVEGIVELAWAVTRFIAPLVLILSMLFWGRRSCVRAVWGVHEETILLARAFAIIGVLLVLAILLIGVTGFKDRWFQPILVAAPVFFAVWAYDCCRDGILRVACWIALGVVVVVAIFIPGKVLFAERTGLEERLNFPLAELGRQMRQTMRPGDAVLAETTFIAGNLRFELPGHRVMSRQWGYEDQQSFWLVWDARKQSLPPERLLRVGRVALTPVGEELFFRARLMRQPSKTYVLGMVCAEKRRP